jgi:tetraprenyl-beta-curcumene synthase
VPPPTTLWTLTPKIFLQVRPYVHQYLQDWRERAARIPDPELRKQALASIATKTFHCEGGSIYALLAGERYRETIRFIVAYQTISDYLDNLCDRSSSLNPDDFRLLHTSMRHALTPGAGADDYYRFRTERDDGGYLASLVMTCQDVLTNLPAYQSIAPALHELADYYCDLQVFKHVRKEERVSLIKAWFDEKKEFLPPMGWHEFAACCGSTVGIFCIVAHASHQDCPEVPVKSIKDAYFPWVQGLHILLDYMIDQDEDSRGGDLNFCSYYKDRRELVFRLTHFYRQANLSISALPYAKFHRLINRGLLGIYCADKKVYRQKEVRKVAREMVFLGGGVSLFFYLVCWVYRRMGAEHLNIPA